MIFFHVTPECHLAQIKQEGLIPQIGTNSKRLNERIPQIYLFHSSQDVENALGNWLGELYNEGERLFILKISLDISDPNLIYQDESVYYESFYRGVITPDKIISILDENEYRP